MAEIQLEQRNINVIRTLTPAQQDDIERNLLAITECGLRIGYGLLPTDLPTGIPNHLTYRGPVTDPLTPIVNNLIWAGAELSERGNFALVTTGQALKVGRHGMDLARVMLGGVEGTLAEVNYDSDVELNAKVSDLGVATAGLHCAIVGNTDLAFSDDGLPPLYDAGQRVRADFLIPLATTYADDRRDAYRYY